jgi:predicted small lipoprotein YifL
MKRAVRLNRLIRLWNILLWISMLSAALNISGCGKENTGPIYYPPLQANTDPDAVCTDKTYDTGVFERCCENPITTRRICQLRVPLNH